MRVVFDVVDSLVCLVAEKDQRKVKHEDSYKLRCCKL